MDSLLQSTHKSNNLSRKKNYNDGSDQQKKLRTNNLKAPLAFAIQHFTRNSQYYNISSQDINNMLMGMQRYINAPNYKSDNQYRVIWQKENVRLLNLIRENNNDISFKGARKSLFLIPSIINRFYILDLLSDHNMPKFLSNHNIDIYILDWGDQDIAANKYRNITLDYYVEEYIIPALDVIKGQDLANQQLYISGYCLGGTLAVIACNFMIAKGYNLQKYFAGLVLLATPWDFEHYRSIYQEYSKKHQSKSKLDYDFWHNVFSYNLSVDGRWLQYSLYNYNPNLIIGKYAKLLELPKNSLEYRYFIAREDWLYDELPIPSSILRQCLFEQNRRYLHEEIYSLPIFTAIAKNDFLVPDSTIIPLVSNFNNRHLEYIDSGHLAMVAGTKAKSKLWQNLLNWMQAN